MTKTTPKERCRMSLKITFVVICTILLAIVLFFLSCKVEFLIAKWLGDIQKVGESGWTSYGNLKWTFSSLLGPAMALHFYAMLALLMLSGLFPSLLLANIIFKLKPFFGTYRWVAVGFAITWALRIPVPLKYSLYYFTCIHF